MANLKPVYLNADTNSFKIPNATDVIIGAPDVTLNTIADLKAYDIESNTGTKTIQVLGYYDAGDNGGGWFYFDSSVTTALIISNSAFSLSSFPIINEFTKFKFESLKYESSF